MKKILTSLISRFITSLAVLAYVVLMISPLFVEINADRFGLIMLGIIILAFVLGRVAKVIAPSMKDLNDLILMVSVVFIVFYLLCNLGGFFTSSDIVQSAYSLIYLSMTILVYIFVSIQTISPEIGLVVKYSDEKLKRVLLRRKKFLESYAQALALERLSDSDLFALACEDASLAPLWMTRLKTHNARHWVDLKENKPQYVVYKTFKDLLSKTSKFSREDEVQLIDEILVHLNTLRGTEVLKGAFMSSIARYYALHESERMAGHEYEYALMFRRILVEREYLHLEGINLLTQCFDQEIEKELSLKKYFFDINGLKKFGQELTSEEIVRLARTVLNKKIRLSKMKSQIFYDVEEVKVIIKNMITYHKKSQIDLETRAIETALIQFFNELASYQEKYSPKNAGDKILQAVGFTEFLKGIRDSSNYTPKEEYPTRESVKNRIEIAV